jgi:hypothetical protein
MGALAPSVSSATAERPPELTASVQLSAAQTPTPELVSAQDEELLDAHPERAQAPASSTDAKKVSASPKKPKHPKARPTERVSDLRIERVRALYDELGRRPEWTEIRDALSAARLSTHPVSRPTAQRIRERVETKEPALAALGSPNVHPLTGTDN